MAQICASCGVETDAPERCDICEGAVLLDGGIRLEEELGRGEPGRTYRARRLADRQVVCVERFVRPVPGVAEVAKVFEREARRLCELEHEGLAEYLDFCRMEGDGEASFYLVREWVSGGGLDADMRERVYTVREVLAVLEELAEVLRELHGASPPVVHGALTPSNVMRRESGRLAVVDVGGIEWAVDKAASGHCVARHAVYVAPEQRRGRVEPRSDLYGLGALGVALLAGVDPKESGAGDRPDLEAVGEVPESFRGLLEELLAPEPQGRPEDAAAVIERVGEAREELMGRASSSGWLPSLGGDLTEVSAEAREQTTVAARRRAKAESPDEVETDVDTEEHVPSAWWMIGAGLVVVAVIVGAQALGLFGVEKTAGVSVADHLCQGTACRGLEKSSLEQFAFGTSVDAMREEGRKLVGGSSEEGAREAVYRTLVDIEGRQAGCELRFDGPEGGLSRFRCELPTEDDEFAAHRNMVRGLLRKLLGRYGRPDVMEGPDDDRALMADETCSGKWMWRGPGGRLELQSQFRGPAMLHRMGREAMQEKDAGVVRSVVGEGEYEGGRIVIEHREGGR
jgi:hypothetical protein